MSALATAAASAKSWTRGTALAIVGIGAADAWHFHAFGKPTDLAMIVAAAAALGVHSAVQSAAASAATTPPGGG